MEILDYQIIYIDNIEGTASIAVFPEKESIDKYTIDLITRAFSKQDRKYKFNLLVELYILSVGKYP